jgi:hypothetical protein
MERSFIYLFCICILCLASNIYADENDYWQVMEGFSFNLKDHREIQNLHNNFLRHGDLVVYREKINLMAQNEKSHGLLFINNVIIITK